MPVRTCIGCRAKAAAPTLLRVVAVDGMLIPDVRHRLPGRGAWLHPDVGCLEAAERRRAFGRALRLSSAPERTRAVAAREAPENSRVPDTTEVRSFLTSKAGRPVVSTP